MLALNDVTTQCQRRVSCVYPERRDVFWGGDAENPWGRPLRDRRAVDTPHRQINFPKGARKVSKIVATE